MRNDGRLESRPDDVEVRMAAQRDTIASRDERDHDASLGELFRRLTGDTTELLRAEVQLAKAEFRETGTRLAEDVMRVGIAAAMALVGTFALTAFLIIAIGNVLDGRYWLSSLIVGVALTGGGYVIVQSAVRDIKQRGITPTQTIDSLREGAQWAKEESRAVKRELESPPSPHHMPGSSTDRAADQSSPRL